jgi:hypothetical protein
MTGQDTEELELVLILLAEYWELVQKMGQNVLVVGAAQYLKSSLALLEIGGIVAPGFEHSLEHRSSQDPQADHRSFLCSLILWVCPVSACSRMPCCLGPLQIAA